MIVNKPIKRIEVHNSEKKHSHNCVKIDITFTAIGLFQKPGEAEIQKLMQAFKKIQMNTNKYLHKCKWSNTHMSVTPSTFQETSLCTCGI